MNVAFLQCLDEGGGNAFELSSAKPRDIGLLIGDNNLVRKTALLSFHDLQHIPTPLLYGNISKIC